MQWRPRLLQDRHRLKIASVLVALPQVVTALATAVVTSKYDFYSEYLAFFGPTVWVRFCLSVIGLVLGLVTAFAGLHWYLRPEERRWQTTAILLIASALVYMAMYSMFRSL